jgi:hypothetical protein
MNNTNTFIYFILYVHHRSGTGSDGRILPKRSAWWEHAKQEFSLKSGSAFAIQKGDLEMHRLPDAVTNHPKPLT